MSDKVLTSLSDCTALANAIPDLTADQAYAVRLAIIDTYEFTATKHLEVGRQLALGVLNGIVGAA